MIEVLNKAEFIGQIIDIFEDFLEARKIVLPTSEEEKREDSDSDSEAIIYGCDYGELQTNLESLLENWEVSESSKEKIYREKLAEYTAQDARERIDDVIEEELTDEQKDSICKAVGESWSFDGEYDCNWNYWDNIDELIRRFK